MTGKKVYLNCAYMSPMLKKVEKAGIRGIHFQRKPDKIMPEHFFNNIEEILRFDDYSRIKTLTKNKQSILHRLFDIFTSINNYKSYLK